LPVVAENNPMSGIESRERTAATRINRIQKTPKARGLVERFADRVSRGELQSVGKPLVEGRLEGVVCPVGDCVLAEDAAEDGDLVGGAAVAGCRIALWRRVFAEADKIQSLPVQWHRGAIRHVERRDRVG